MSLSIAALVLGSLATMTLVSGAVGWATHNRQSSSRWAADAWRGVTHRNGVTGVIPFAPTTARINAPGMVEVFPRSHTPERPIHAWESADIPGDRPRHTSNGNSEVIPTVRPGDEPVTELPCPPLELSTPPDPAERARCRRLYAQGLSQTKLIKEVWGLSKGGGAKYAEARRRFRMHVSDIARPDLRYALQREEAQNDA